jgi:anti-sigma factor RsiW
MTCHDAELLLHGLIDGELDAGHAGEVEAHVEGCRRCAAQLRSHHELRDAVAAGRLRHAAPASLRRRIEMMAPPLRAQGTSRRAMLKGFAMGTAVSTALAASLVVAVLQTDADQHVIEDIVSAHVRSLQGDHLTDVQTSDQHTVKPWFNGKVDVAPPVVDLTAQGFRLIGGRLDYTNGKAVAAIVYRRRTHVINLFVAPAGGTDQHETNETIRGFNIRRWTAHGLECSAVSDLNAEELQEFVEKFDAALGAAPT